MRRIGIAASIIIICAVARADDRLLANAPASVTDMLDHAPTLRRQLDELARDGWKIELSRHRSPLRVAHDRKLIVLDEADLAAHPSQLADAVVEAKAPYGFAKWDARRDLDDFHAEQDWRRRMNQSAAFLATFDVRDEVVKNGGKDPGLPWTPARADKAFVDRVVPVARDRSLTGDARVAKMAEAVAGHPVPAWRPTAGICNVMGAGG